MPLDWNGMVFVQRWRSAIARGFVVGIRRPRDRTVLDVRIHGAELSIGSAQNSVEIELLDTGDIARERRIAILDRLSVVVEARVDTFELQEGAVKSHPIGARRPGEAAREAIRRGVRLCGIPGDNDGGRSFVLDIGFPIVVTLPEGEPIPSAESAIALTAPGELRGYIVVG